MEKEEIKSDTIVYPQCPHQHNINLDGIIICEDCGQQLEEYLLEEQFYVASNKGAPRYNYKKDTSRSLYPDLEARGFPQNIIDRANRYYVKMIENNIYRSKNRMSVVFVSVLQAYQDFGDPVSSSELAKKFGLNRKGVSKGLLLFSKIFKNEVDKNHIGPIDLIPKILSDIGIEPTEQSVYIRDIRIVYNYAATNSMAIQKSIPRTIAAGLVYYYLILKKYPITKENYSKLVKLTETTITNSAIEVGKALKCPVEI